MAGSHRLRLGRFSESGRPYLITAATADRRRWFSDWRRGRIVVRTLARESPSVTTICFVVMPDHLHWLFRLDEDSLSTVVQRVKSVSSREICATAGCSGPIWQKGFHDRALRRDEDIRAVAKYVVANPLRAGIVKTLRMYPLWDAMWL